ncbi:MAG: hypothetical protein K8F91_00905 [Candidatus Obscuribacterales bacterium]|nr:hypothetical protein [Candidatus Obscuribacterales bacterium]
MRLKSARRSQKGQSLVETLAGFLVLIPLALVAVNLVVMLSCSRSNSEWAEQAARAAARRLDMQTASTAAEDAVALCQLNNMITNIVVTSVEYDLGIGQVTVITEMDVKLPVPFPGWSSVQFHNSAVQPIVATPAPV